MKSSYSTRELRRYHLSLQAVQGLSWVTLAGVVWLGVIAVVRYVPLPALLSTLLLTLVRALAGVWTLLGWLILGLFALLLAVVVWFHGLYPSWGAYLRSFAKTFDFRSDWLRAGKRKQDEKGLTSESNSDVLDGYFAFLGKGVVLVVVLVPKGIDGLDVVNHAAPAIKAYADDVLPGLHSGSMQEVAGARYWVYRR